MYQIVFFYLIGAFTVLLLLVELWKCYLNKTILKNYGSIKGYPIIGAIPYLWNLDNENILRAVSNWSDSIESKPFYIWFGPLLFCFVDEAEDFKVILNSDQVLNKGFFYESHGIGKSLLVIFSTTF